MKKSALTTECNDDFLVVVKLNNSRFLYDSGFSEFSNGVKALVRLLAGDVGYDVLYCAYYHIIEYFILGINIMK